jgi:hypothetical protein
MKQQSLSQEIIPVHHQYLYLSEQSIDVLHLDIIKIFLHTKVCVLNDEDEVANLIDQLGMSRWRGDVAFELP